MRVTYDVKLCVLIRAMRNAMNLNQGELALAAGCSRPTINRIERLDKASPRSNTIDDIFHIFRAMGIEIHICDEDVSIKFSKKSLLNAEEKIKRGGTNDAS